MGTVYRAHQSKLGREVAIKVLDPRIARQEIYADRFIREARTSATLEHPNIVPIYDYGTKEEYSYVVMRLLEGGTLEQRIIQRSGSTQPLPTLHDIRLLLNEISDALQYAHDRKIVHRDIKLSNVMFDDRGVPYLVDFGIAKVLAADDDNITNVGVLLGTPSSMPPEQWRSQDLTPAADQYALGVLVYRLVTGQLPFRGRRAHDLMNEHLNTTPPLAHEVNPRLPAVISPILSRTMEKQPHDRYPSVTAFAKAFAEAVGDESEQSDFFLFEIDHDLIDETQRTMLGQKTSVEPQFHEDTQSTTFRTWWWAALAGLLILGVLTVAVALGIVTNQLNLGSLFSNPTIAPTEVVLVVNTTPTDRIVPTDTEIAPTNTVIPEDSPATNPTRIPTFNPTQVPTSSLIATLEAPIPPTPNVVQTSNNTSMSISGEVLTDSFTLRSEPNLNSTRVEDVEESDPLTILGSVYAASDVWYLVEGPTGDTGWILSDWVHLDNSDEIPDTAINAVEVLPTPIGVNALGTTRFFDLHTQPLRGSEITQTLQDSTELSILAVAKVQNEPWYYVQTESQDRGWVILDRLEVQPTPTPTFTLAPTEPIVITVPEVVINRNETPLRQNPDPNSVILVYLQQNLGLSVRMQVDIQEDVWYFVETENNFVGWVTGDAVDFNETQIIPAITTPLPITVILTIEADDTRLFVEPFVTSELVTSLNGGVKLPVLGRANSQGTNWYQVSLESGDTAWVLSNRASLNVTQVVANSNLPEVTIIATPDANVAVAAISTLANVRSGPSKAYELLGVVRAGDVYPIVAGAVNDNNEIWYILDLGADETVWIWSQLVTVSPSNATIRGAATVPAPS